MDIDQKAEINGIREKLVSPAAIVEKNLEFLEKHLGYVDVKTLEQYLQWVMCWNILPAASMMR